MECTHLRSRAALALTLLLVACSPEPRDDEATLPVIRPEDARWDIVEVGSEASFRGLDIAPDGSVWASGAHGTVVRSTDGGRSWTDVSVVQAQELDLRDIEAFGPNDAVVISAGYPARVFVTSDGGASWRMTHEDLREEIFFDAMAFWDRDHGIAFGDPIDGRFVVITTRDGGQSWAEVPPDALPPALEDEAGFAASGSCLTVFGERHVWFGTGGDRARVFRSADRGESWQVSETPIAHGGVSTGIFSIAFLDENVGIAVGGDYRQPEIAAATGALTKDGGATWELVPAGPGGFRSAVRYLDDDGTLVVSVGSHGTSLSVDGGTSWTTLGDRGFHALAVTPDGDRTTWAIGAEGVAGRLIYQR